MTLNRQVLFWIGALALFAAALWLLSGMLLPFIAGLTVAYFLDPVANRLQRFGFSRLVATILILLLFLGILVALGVIFIPVLIEQFGNFLDALPGIVQALEDMVPPAISDWLRASLGTSGGAGGRPSLGQFAGQGAAWLGTVLGSLWSGGQSLLSLIALVVLAPVIAFYMLLDWGGMIETVDSWIPLHQRRTIEELGREIDAAVAGFVRGQATVCVLLGAFYALGLSIVGLDFGLLIGLTAGILSFIPFVGSTTGFLLSAGVALVQFWNDWLMIGAVIGVFALGQFLEGNILQPRLVGRSVGLHPVWLMFALLAFTYLFGFVGALVAVPVSAAIGVLTRFALRQYLASPLYTGEAKPTPVLSHGDGEKRAPGR